MGGVLPTTASGPTDIIFRHPGSSDVSVRQGGSGAGRGLPAQSVNTLTNVRATLANLGRVLTGLRSEVMLTARSVSSPAAPLVVGAVVALALAAGAAIVFVAPTVSPLAIIFPLTAASLIAVRHGVWALSAAVVLPLTGLNPVLASIGNADIRWSDALVPALVLATFAWGRSQRLAYRYLVPVALLGLASLGSALFVSRDAESLLSALRFSITLSLAFFVVWLCRDSRDLRFVLRATAAGIIVGLGISAVVGPAGDGIRLGERFGFGLLGPNMLGLVSAFLVLLGMTRSVSSRRSVRLLLVASGISGLFLAKSVGSTVALAVSLALLYGLRNREIRLGRVLVLLALLLGIAVVAVAALRPTSLPWHRDFGEGSAQQRLITGYAGIRVFLEHPLMGVGWANSAEAIGSPDIAAVLRTQLPSRNALLYPDVQPTSVHNAYAQLLAELGLLGVLVIAWLVWSSIRVGRDLIRSDHPEAPFVLGSLMLFAVWWNETSLFGGQPETFLFALTIGMTAMIHAQVPARGGAPPRRSLASSSRISSP